MIFLEVYRDDCLCYFEHFNYLVLFILVGKRVLSYRIYLVSKWNSKRNIQYVEKCHRKHDTTL